jgi:hypothetical protein
LNIDETKRDLEMAQANAFALSLGIAYPTSENTVMLLQIAHREAYALSTGAAIPTRETIADLLRRAHMEMLSLSSRVPTLEEKAEPPEKSEKG